MKLKNRKKLFNIILLVFAVIIIVWGALLYHWNTDPEAICNRAGGFWGPLNNNNCSDLCNYSQSGYDCESRLRTMGCSCGLDKCWNGNECVSVE